MDAAIVSAIVGAVLTIIAAALAANHALNRRWAIRRALASTSGNTKALRSAVRFRRDELRPSVRNGEALQQSLLETMGSDANENLVAEFLNQLHKRFADRNMHVEWDPPSPRYPRQQQRNWTTETQMFGRKKERETVCDLIANRCNIVIRGAPGIGKTTLLDSLRETFPSAVSVRLEQGGDPLRDLRIALHRFCRADFPTDDDQGIEVIARNLPDNVVMLVDNADEEATAAAIMRLASHLPSLTMVVTSRGQAFSGFKHIDLSPLPADDAAKLLSTFSLSEEEEAKVLESSEGNPLLMVQAGWAATEGAAVDVENRLERVLSRFSNDERRALSLIGELPSATVPSALLIEIGKLTNVSLTALRHNAVLKPVESGFNVHETFRAICRDVHRTVPREHLSALRVDIAENYSEWLRTNPSLTSIDVARPNCIHLIRTVDQPVARAELTLALIGDNRDDPNGYLPSVGLTGLLLECKELLTETANMVGGIMAAQLEKNLGLFSYLANDPTARSLLLSARSRYEKLGDRDGRAATSWILGYIADDSCQYYEAQQLYSAPLEWLEDDEGRAICYHLVGCSLYHQGRLAEARRSFERARLMAHDVNVQVRIERRLAYVALMEGQTLEALEKLETARERARTLNRPRDIARLARHLGVGWLRLGDLNNAETELIAAKENFEAIGDRRGLGSTLRNLATLRRMQGRLNEARELALTSREIASGEQGLLFVEMTSPYGVAAAEEELGRIALASGNEAATVVHFRRACNTMEAIGHARSRMLAHELGTRRNCPIPASRGVIFDLMSILSDVSLEQYEDLKRFISDTIGVSFDRFEIIWENSRKRALADPYWSSSDRVRWVAAQLGKKLHIELCNSLAEYEQRFWKSSAYLRHDAVEVLEVVRARGLQVALVLNGSSAMRGLPAAVGIESLVDAALFSCDAGSVQPEKGIYEQVLEIFDLPAKDCIYIGDGRDRALEGAKAVGMFAVRLLVGERSRYRSGASVDWDTTAHSLSEVASWFEKKHGGEA